MLDFRVQEGAYDYQAKLCNSIEMPVVYLSYPPKYTFWTKIFNSIQKYVSLLLQKFVSLAIYAQILKRKEADAKLQPRKLGVVNNEKSHQFCAKFTSL